jgi:hypothetical protein
MNNVISVQGVCMLNKKLLGMMALLVGIMLVFTLVACDNSVSSGGSNPFIGTWHGFDPDGYGIRVVITSSNWTLTRPDYPWRGSDTGTYTNSGNEATFFQQGIIFGTATISGNVMTVRVSGMGDLFLSR